MARAIVRTLKLTKPIHDAGQEILELEFHEPTGAVFDELERASEWNANAKRREDIIATGLALLEHLTGLDGSAISTLCFDDRKAANEIAADLMGARLGLGKR